MAAQMDLPGTERPGIFSRFTSGVQRGWAAGASAGGVAKRTWSAGGRYFGGPTHQRGMRDVRALWGMHPDTKIQRMERALAVSARTGTPYTSAFKSVSRMGIGRFIGPAFLGMAAYSGYQEGGVAGAAAGLAKESALWYAFGVLGKPLLLGAGAVAGAAAVIGGAMALGGVGPRQLARPYVHEYMRKHAKLEMGTPVLDQFGTVATMRQRSLQAISNSKVNARTALGNEAFLLR